MNAVSKCQPPESPLLFFYPNMRPSSSVPKLAEKDVKDGVNKLLRYGVYAYTSSDFNLENPKVQLLQRAN